MTGWLSSLAAVLLAGVILYAMQHTAPLYSDIIAPVPVASEQTEPGGTSRFDVRINAVHLAKRVTVTGIARARNYETGGVWVLVEATAGSKTESLTLTSVFWRGANGIRYAQSQRLQGVPGAPGAERLEPGLPRPILMVFEIPADQIVGARLQLAHTTLMPLVEEASITMTEIRPDDIKSNITISRNRQDPPWTLEAEG